MKLIERINHSNSIPFKHTVIIGCNDVKNSPYLIQERFIDNTSVPVSDIIGTCHSNYYGITWGDFLLHGQQITSSLANVDTSPEYYYSTEKKDHIGFIKLPNGYFIEEGNHRSAIAKFLFFLDGNYNHSLLGVYVTEHILDTDGKTLVEDLSSIIDKCGFKDIITITLERVPVKNDAANYLKHTNFYCTKLTMFNNKTSSIIVIDGLLKEKSRQKIRDLITAIDKRRWWSHLFSTNEFSKFVG